MKNINQVMKSLERLGYKIEYGNGSLAKIYHPDKNKPFYSFHIGERGLHPLRRFARKNWGLDLSRV